MGKIPGGSESSESGFTPPRNLPNQDSHPPGIFRIRIHAPRESSESGFTPPVNLQIPTPLESCRWCQTHAFAFVCISRLRRDMVTPFWTRHRLAAATNKGAATDALPLHFNRHSFALPVHFNRHRLTILQTQQTRVATECTLFAVA
jgi:hypothetical protein